MASSEDGTTFSTPMVTTNGADLTVPDGRYLQVTVDFERSSDVFGVVDAEGVLPGLREDLLGLLEGLSATLGR